MSEQEKQLLLVDLCARLPYGLIISPMDCGKAKLIGFKDGGALLFDLILQKEYDKLWDVEYIKPYLRPMSSMTEEEKKEYWTYQYQFVRQCLSEQKVNTEIITEFIDWLNKNHFDYRKFYDEDKKKWMSMIEKGLAIEVTEENNPYKD